MRDAACTAFLQWALPRLGRRWDGYRKVGRLVCKRLGARLRTLGPRALPRHTSDLPQHPRVKEALMAAGVIVLTAAVTPTSCR